MKFAVIFDLDGTLIDSTAMIPQIAQQVAGGFGLTLTPAELVETTHFPFTVWVGNWNKSRGLSIEVKDVIQKYAAIEETYLHDHSILSLGVSAFVKELHGAGVLLGIATSAPRARLDNILHVSEVGHYFDATISIDEVTRAKPDPEPYLKVARLLNISPTHCVGIEDTTTGLSSLIRAGMRSVGYAPKPESVSALNGADLVVTHFSQLSYERLEQLVKR